LVYVATGAHAFELSYERAEVAYFFVESAGEVVDVLEDSVGGGSLGFVFQLDDMFS
jgi:hypothetical protein